MTIWRPFTQEKTAKASIKIVKGLGPYLFVEDGKRYLDMISSWWVNILGHSNKEIADAIYEQAKTLEHVIFAGFSHDPAQKLTDELQKLLPKELCYFFFSDNGSTAVEVALKMAYQYFKNLKKKDRNIFINLEGGYHGDTLGAMSAAGKSSDYHATFSEFFFETFSIDFPEFYIGVENIEEKEEKSVEKLKSFLKRKGYNVCALIVEPLIQGAAGMRTYRPEFLNRIVEEVRKYGILVIFDEVMTGFFRAGTMFAMEQTTVVPDLICLSKGITGGFLPLSLTIATGKIYKAFLSDDWKKALIHGHSYTANPISCAAACKSLEILKRKETQDNIKNINHFYEHNTNFNSAIYKKRIQGTIFAIDVSDDIKAKKARDEMFNMGVIIRPINNSIYLIPPYCVGIDNLEYVFKNLEKSLLK
ncbi:MAG: adenosylmethionine--8-amino-7-oxononanoate transaminase [Holosporales bacterium]|jgi:adenosylmethionine-8-amino-7-oxononanoate aminotransferase|nr:adenosylmethionine--8-amino-7-oxononanoate transaminase [Holosporales bacterium]